MEGVLSLAQINAAQAGAKKGSTGLKKFAIVRNDEGNLEKIALSKVTSAQIGGFQGRAGSKRRSRKGAVRILANGRRFFVQDWKSPVVSYKP